MKKIIEMLKKALKINIFVFALTVAMLNSSAYAQDCKETYGGGETCTYDREFKIEKKVRVKGDSSWQEKVTSVEKGKVVEFRIRIKNTGNIDVDNMSYKDDLPDELERIGGADLKEFWEEFSPGETKEFVIEAKIKDSEFDADNFDKCVVNKVTLRHGDKDKGSDTATVCYGNGKVTELPETGPASTIALTMLGFGLLAAGALVKRVKLA